jgi:hypothetical protein
LTCIKHGFDAAQKRIPHPVRHFFQLNRRSAMPADAMILSAAIVTVFVVFGAVLYWGEARTRSLSQDTAAEAKAKRRSF